MKSFSELTSASQVNNEDLVAISQTSGSGYASKKTTVKDITDKSNLNLAEEYDSTSTYAVGDYVIYESVLYKCIASTTGTFDSTKWTSVVVTDEMGSGGGGGTGGHTIIDENGNSMTARAGLQFVGANVSDDATNNKTIVDLASAGGIDGVFVDTENVITTLTGTGGSFADYLATEDCFVIGTITGASNSLPAVQIDGVTVAYINNSTYTIGICVSAKRGQTISYRMSSQSTLTVFGIQTGTTHSKFQPVIYSLEEREIGVWTDGKPLYEKTIDLGNTVSISYNSWTLLDYDISNIETLVYCNTPNYGNLMAGKNPNGQLQCQTARNNDTVTSRYLTLQYTKTTDTAGSGSWTPQGVPAVHYTTDEQVIGTYLGETLYEKTIVVSALSIGENTINHLISGIGEIIKVEGKANYSGDCINMPYTSTVTGYVIGIQANATRILINVGASFNANDFSNISITLQYTKSS